MANRAKKYLAYLLITLLGLGVLVYLRDTSSKFDGVWLKTGGAAIVPDEIRLSMRHHQFHVRYPDLWHLTVPLDGQEHKLSSLGNVDTYYRAELHGDEAVVAERTTSLVPTDVHCMTPSSCADTKQWSITETKRWLLTEGGHKLVVSAEGKEETFRRASWLHALLTNRP
ncbi:MAG: hypothetical protein ACLPLR_08595 [Terriglobales bacterium]